MRILMLTEFYLPVRGGIEQHVRSLSTELVARGHDVAIATIWQEGLPEYEEDGRVRVYRMRGLAQRAAFLHSETGRRHAAPVADPELVLGLRKVITREHPDIVHAHNWLVHSFIPLKTWSHAPLVVSLHDYGLVCSKQRLQYQNAPCSGPGLRCLSCAASHYGLKGIPLVLAHSVAAAIEKSAVDMFLPVSQAVAEGNRLAESRLPYQVIPNFVPDDVVSAAVDDAHTGQLPESDYMLFVGDVSEDKGARVLLEAYARLGNTIPLVLVGRRSMTIPPAVAHNVYVLPSMPHDAVMRAWSKSLVALAPSVWPDPCPTVVMEAMASGRPVIASRIGGLPDLVVDGETGLLVPPGNPAALGQAMQALVSQPEVRLRMGNAAKRAVVRFQASTVVPRIERVYEQLTQSKRA